MSVHYFNRLESLMFPLSNFRRLSVHLNVLNQKTIACKLKTKKIVVPPAEPPRHAAGRHRLPPGGADKPRPQLLPGQARVRRQGSRDDRGDLQPVEPRPVSSRGQRRDFWESARFYSRPIRLAEAQSMVSRVIGSWDAILRISEHGRWDEGMISAITPSGI